MSQSNPAGTNLSQPELLEMYRKMSLIRRMEECLSVEINKGSIPGPLHLYVGEEAVAVGVCANLTDRDWIASTHRGHGHFLAKGGDPKAMMAEIFGRATGICGGKGGSMHVADFSRGIVGANGIVAGGIGLATGAAWAAQLDKRGEAAVAFFGDGAANEGVLMEALNLAAIWRLPLILVCENNGFSEFSPTETVTAGAIFERAHPFGVPGVAVDGNDVLEVWQATNAALRRARAGEGPSLIEARTYRLFGHTETEVSFLTAGYREDTEVAEWRVRDPIPRFAAYLTEHGLAEASALDGIVTEVEKTVEEALAFALDSPWPELPAATDHMYA